jgi:hypothetical protein
MEPKREISSRQNDDAAIKLLAQLKEKLHSGDMSKARRAAHNLSWMQDAGFDILKQALLNKSSIGTKIAAAYGLRCMRGRMRKTVLEVLLQGLQSPNDNTRRVCTKTALMLTGKTQTKSVSESDQGSKKFKLREIPAANGKAIHPGSSSVQHE